MDDNLGTVRKPKSKLVFQTLSSLYYITCRVLEIFPATGHKASINPFAIPSAMPGLLGLGSGRT